MPFRLKAKRPAPSDAMSPTWSLSYTTHHDQTHVRFVQLMPPNWFCVGKTCVTKSSYKVQLCVQTSPPGCTWGFHGPKLAQRKENQNKKNRTLGPMSVQTRGWTEVAEMGRSSGMDGDGRSSGMDNRWTTTTTTEHVKQLNDDSHVSRCAT